MRPTTVHNQGVETSKGLVIREYDALCFASVRELTVVTLESSGAIVEETLRARVEEVETLEPQVEHAATGRPLVVTSISVASNCAIGPEN